mmetsp:Transcript_34022/g.97859  ORF Transcript_34022/g.97859 Transcript_34022/m.97859 type:complete len:201 (+) Transcript_34022:998-1600(+)
MSMAMGMPAASWIHETAQVASKQLRSLLFWMLYWTLKKYHSPTKIGSLNLLKSSIGPLAFFSTFTASSPSDSADESAAALAAAKAVAAKISDMGASMEALEEPGTAADHSAAPASGGACASGRCANGWACCHCDTRRPGVGTWKAWLRLLTVAHATNTTSTAGKSADLARMANLWLPIAAMTSEHGTPGDCKQRRQRPEP